MNYRFVRTTLLVVALAFLPACASAPALTPSPTAAIVITDTSQPSQTPAPTLTETPSPTSTITPSVTPTATASSTPMPSFAGFTVEYAQATSYGMLIGFKIPGIKENFRLKVNDAEFKCSLNEKTPDRLYCYGVKFSTGQNVKLTFLPLSGDDTPVYETNYKVGLLGTPTLEPTALYEAAKACKIRGVHVTCETEYRNGNNGYCIVSTCVDLCGYYYSVDNCPAGSENNGIYPMTGTPPMPGPR